MGHSFGGKVALAYLARRPGQVDRAFVFDSDPGARPEGQRDPDSRRVLDLLAAMPRTFASRDAFLALAEAQGLSRRTAEWLAMNVRRAPGGEDGFRLRLDLPVLSTMLDDYFRSDLWPVLEDPQSAGHIRVVLGGRSESVPPDTRARLEALADRAPWLSVRVLEQAGHWVHADDPDGLFAAVTELL
jgi:pimeloyl-ACP methyl ester carboxylesterase